MYCRDLPASISASVSFVEFFVWRSIVSGILGAKTARLTSGPGGSIGRCGWVLGAISISAKNTTALGGVRPQFRMPRTWLTYWPRPAPEPCGLAVHEDIGPQLPLFVVPHRVDGRSG